MSAVTKQMKDVKSKLKSLLRKGKLMAPPDISGFKTFLGKLTQGAEGVEASNYYESVQPQTSLIHSIVLVGFHHTKGSQVEFQYPPDAAESDLIPYLALPDSAHNEDADFAYFLVEISGQWKYGVSCYRQQLNTNRSGPMHRNYVQKSIVVLSNIPLFGTITGRMEGITQTFFQEGLKDTAIIQEMYGVLSQGMTTCTVADLHVGFSLRKLVRILREKVLILWKLVLLEGRIIVFSRTASKVSSALTALLSLFPGQLCFSSTAECFSQYKSSLLTYGLPLHIFNPNYFLSPLLSLVQLDQLSKPSFLIGCTNQMIIEHHKSMPHAVLDLDSGELVLNVSTQVAAAVKFSRKEKEFVRNVVKLAESGEEVGWKGQEQVQWSGSDDNIRTEFNGYLKAMLSNLALVRLRSQLGDSENPDEESKEEGISYSDSRKKDGEYESFSPHTYKNWRLKKLLKQHKSKFLYQWSNTYSFKVWLQTYNVTIAYRSVHAGVVNSIEIIYENGDRFIGDLCQGLRQGRGALYESGGGKYEGQWESDKKHGVGMYMNCDYVYDGEWKEDQRWGLGKEIAGTSRYSGGFSGNKYHGQGTYIDAEGSIYEGDWVDGQRHGIAHWQGVNGDSYTGEYKENNMHGEGQLRYSNGDIYSGQFVKGVREGIGQVLKSNGEIFKGIFRNGTETGPGSLIKPNGVVVNAYFSEGKMTPQSCQVFFPDGRVYKGDIDEDGNPHGEGVMELPSGNSIVALWRHGVQKDPDLQ